MARAREKDDFYFEGFANPNTTPVPDVVFDRFLARLKEGELKALLYIIRRTFGFQKDHDPISFNQFLRGITTRDGRVLDEGCGIRDRTTLSRALQSLETMGIVRSAKGRDLRGENETTVYTLRFKNAPVENAPQGVVGNSYHPGRKFPLPVVGNSYPQETGLQETDQQQTDQYSNKRQTITRHKTIDPQGYGKLRVRSNVDNLAKVESEVDDDGAPDDESLPPARSVGMAKIAGVLKQRQLTPAIAQKQGSGAGRGRPPKAPDYLAATMEDISAKLHDDAPRSSLTLATKLWKRSGLPEDKFVQRLHEAKSITHQQGGVRGKPAADDQDLVNRMMYFFPVVEDLLGLKDQSAVGS